jgi:hypothetical protein
MVATCDAGIKSHRSRSANWAAPGSAIPCLQNGMGFDSVTVGRDKGNAHSLNRCEEGNPEGQFTFLPQLCGDWMMHHEVQVTLLFQWQSHADWMKGCTLGAYK